MKYEILISIEPQQVLVWTCVIVFIATSAITLLGLIKKIEIEKVFLNRLFIALILEVVSIGVLAFKNSFSPAPIVEFVKIVTPKSGFQVGQNKTVFIDGAYNKTIDETVTGLLEANNKTITISNNSKEYGIFSATIDSSLLDKSGKSFVFLLINKKEKKVSSDSISLQK